MNSPAPRSPRSRSQAGGRRSSRPPSHLYSDCPPEPEDSKDSPSLGQRSVSLTTLQPTIIQPRMAQLETLEAKMASIEVSLSSTPRRKKNGSITPSIRSIPKELATKELEALKNALRDKENIIQSLKGQLSIPGLRFSHIRGGNNVCNNLNGINNRELSENEKKQAEERLSKLRTETDNKRLTIKNLKMALERLDITDNIDVRIQQAELEYQLGREELNLLTLLEETRAIQLCLEECNKLTSESHTLYSCFNGEAYVSLHAMEITYDQKCPRFGAGPKNSAPGLWVDWALEDTGLKKDDRLIEVNGKIVLTKTREDLLRLLSAAPDPAQIVVLRKNSPSNKISGPILTNSSKEVSSLRSELGVVRERAEEAQRAKDGLVSDNIRLTHRISYLEEQVAELLSRKNADGDIRILTQSPVITSTVKTSQNVTNINISSQPTAPVTPNTKPSKDVQVFQKGPQVTALVANIPGLEVTKEAHTSLPVRSKSSLSNVSNTHIHSQSPTESYSCHKGQRLRHRNARNSLQTSRSSNSLDQPEKNNHRTHHHHHHDYEATSLVEHASRHHRKATENGHNKVAEYNPEASLMDQNYKKATKIVYDLTRNGESKSTLYEKHRQKCLSASEKYDKDILRHYNARKSTSVLDFRSEIQIMPKYSDSKSIEGLNAIEIKAKSIYKKPQDIRSVKSLDFDSDNNSFKCNGHKKSLDYTSEPTDNKISYYSSGENLKPRPAPPKKPLRLSLHRPQSVQSVETPSTTPSGSPDKNDSRRPMKRNHKGEAPQIPILGFHEEKSHERNDLLTNGHRFFSKIEHLRQSSSQTNINDATTALKWSGFNHMKYRENLKN